MPLLQCRQELDQISHLTRRERAMHFRHGGSGRRSFFDIFRFDGDDSPVRLLNDHHPVRLTPDDSGHNVPRVQDQRDALKSSRNQRTRFDQ